MRAFRTSEFNEFMLRLEQLRYIVTINPDSVMTLFTPEKIVYDADKEYFKLYINNRGLTLSELFDKYMFFDYMTMKRVPIGKD